MEVAMWGIFASLIWSPSLQSSLDYYRAPDMVSFILSGLILTNLVDLVQPFRPVFFVRGYKHYNNRSFSIWLIAIAKSLDQAFFWRAADFVIYVAFASLVFNVRLDMTSPAFWCVIALGATFTLGINLFAAGWLMVTKSGQDPVNWFFSVTARLLTGELIPIKSLPSFLVHIAMIHPKTYVQILGRRTILGHESLAQILPELGLLVLAALSSFFLGYVAFRVCLRRAKMEGTMKW